MNWKNKKDVETWAEQVSLLSAELIKLTEKIKNDEIDLDNLSGDLYIISRKVLGENGLVDWLRELKDYHNRCIPSMEIASCPIYE